MKLVMVVCIVSVRKAKSIENMPGQEKLEAIEEGVNLAQV